MKRIKPFLPAIGIFCCALLVRIIYNLTVARYYTPMYDSHAYQAIAFNVVSEHCYCEHPFIPTVYRAPLWPWIIAGISLIFGRADIYDRLFLCCIGSGTCVFIYLLARDFFGTRIGIIAGLFACIYPSLYIYDGWMYTESLFTFLMVAVFYCVYRIQKDEGQRRSFWIICGVLLGLLSLTRPNGIIIIALVVLWVIFMSWRKLLRKGALKKAALAILIAGLLIVPWTIRNYIVSGSLIPVATGDGTVLLGSYNDKVLVTPGFVGSWINPLQTNPQVLKPFPLYTCAAPCEVQREDVSKAAALQWIQTHLHSMPRLLVDHLVRFWTPITREADLPMYRFPGQFSSLFVLGMSDEFPKVVFILAALGLIVTLRKRWRELLFAYSVILITMGEAIAYYGNSRFRMPVEPLLILLAAGAIWWLTQDAPGTLRQILRRRGTKAQPLTDKPQNLQPVEHA